MELKLHDTLTRAKRTFTPIDPARVRMYVCGPTVYDFAHIGNARPVIVFDVLFRLLRHIYGDSHVTYVRNITDVDDKINARAAERGAFVTGSDFSPRMLEIARARHPAIEFRVADASAYAVGQELKVSDVISAGDIIDVTGITKGKGFQGVVRRYGFAGQTAGHGTHESFRGPGSVGNRSFPGRIFRGKRMDGHMGSAQRTTLNLKVVQVRADDGLVLVHGALPGAPGERVVLRRAVKQKVASR